MDYIYTAFHQAHVDGTPVVQPLWFQYPKDPATFPIDLQFLYGDSILVSPVTEDDATSVSIYLPADTFYDFGTLAPVRGEGKRVVLDDVSFTEIPVHIRGGAVVPMRVASAMTTAGVREKDFEFVVAPGGDGRATGRLYVDDGVSEGEGGGATEVRMEFGEGELVVRGEFGYGTGVGVARVRFLGVWDPPTRVWVDGEAWGGFWYDGDRKVLDVRVGLPFDRGFSVGFA